ncbi:MAG: phosphohistidine phosphatase SixA [Desulforhopalus sp.]
MALFLVQHGISVPKDVDPAKGLTDEGFTETERIADVAKGYKIKIEKIVHSGKKRAKQTAAVYHNALSVAAPLELVSGINPMDDVRVFAAGINPDSNVMVVGHMPFMQRLVSYLTTGSEATRVYQFQNSGIVCLDCSMKNDGTFDWYIRWTLNPHIS